MPSNSTFLTINRPRTEDEVTEILDSTFNLCAGCANEPTCPGSGGRVKYRRHPPSGKICCWGWVPRDNGYSDEPI